ncbi:MAG TPA: tetratricopeptide repeat protein [Bryobacteraceae bacterium]|nr:tetratricopeptide repeat protein [Bryobacteraceae bacterium]
MILGFGRTHKFDYERWITNSMLEDGRWLVRAFWKRIALFACIGLGASAAYNHWSPQEYVSRATVRFIPPQVADAYASPKESMHIDQRIFAVTQQATSRLTAAQMIEVFGLYPQRRRFYPIADLVPEFQKRLKFTKVATEGSDKGIPSILISFSDADPNKAQKVVQRIVELVYEENRRYRSDESIGTTDFLDQEIKGVTAHIQEIETQLSKLPTPGGEDKEYRNILKVENLYSKERRLTEIEHEMSLVQTERNLRKSLVSDLEARLARTAEKGLGHAPANSTEADRLRASLASAELAYDNLRHRYNSNYPGVVAAQEAVNSLQGQLAKQLQQDSQAEHERELSAIREPLSRARSELAGYEESLQHQIKEQARLTAEVARLRAQFDVGSDVENARLQLMREYEAAKTQFAELSRRQHESHLASDVERHGRGETAELVEPPTLPSRAEMPTEPMLLWAGALFGSLLGYAAALLSFFAAPKVRTPRHIGLFGDYPVLVNLPGRKPSSRSTITATPLTRLSMLVLALTIVSSAGCGSFGNRIPSELSAGNAALKAGDYRVAEIRFRKAIQLDARNGEAHVGLASACRATGNSMCAYEQLIRAAELLPDRSDIAEHLADLTYQVYFADPGRPIPLLREMEVRANNLMKKWPTRPTGFRLAGQVLFERHRTAEAIKLIKDALEHIEDGDLRTQLASFYFRNGEQIEAEDQLRRAIQVNPAYTPAFDLLYLQLMERGEVPAARGVLEDKLQRNHSLESALQLAAHDDARGARDLASGLLEKSGREFASAPEAFARIGDFWLHRGEFATARRWYQEGLARNATDRGLYAGRLAEVFVAEKKPLAAQALVNQELSAHPKDPFLRAYHAALGLDNQSVSERRKMQAELESVLTRMPNSPFVRLHLGRAYLLNGDLLRAGELFRNVIALDPNYAPGWLALADVELRNGNSTQAQEHLQMLLHRTPRYTPARLLLAKASLEQNKPAEAEQALSALLADDPANTEVMMTLARAKIILGQREAAAQLLERSAALRPQDPLPVLIKARLDVQSGRLKIALESLRSAQKRLGDAPQVASMLGSVALLADQPAVALGQFEALVKRDHDNLQYRLGYATSLALSGKTAQAREQFEFVQKRAGNDPQPWLLYGAMMSSAGNTAAARSAYQEVLKRDSKNPYALNNLAFLLAYRGEDLDNALAMAEEAQHVLPRSRETNDTLAYVYVCKGMKRNAAATLEQLAAILPASQQGRTLALLEQVQRGDLQGVRREMEKADVVN